MKKVIRVVIETDLDDDQINEGDLTLTVGGVHCYHEDGNESVHSVPHDCVKARVIHSDKVKEWDQ